jgi:hypothetical protein
MPIYSVNFDVRYFNGCKFIEADDVEDARRKFDQIPCEKLIEDTDDVAAEI